MEAEMPIYDFFKDFAGPLATVVASAAALCVTWRLSSTQSKTAEAQKNIALDNLNFVLFDKRYEIYNATRALIDHVKARDLASSDPEWRALNLKIREGCFFFDEPTQAFLNEVWTVSDRILLTRDQLEQVNRESDEETWQALVAKLSADEARLSEMYGKLLPSFKHAMAFFLLVKERDAVTIPSPPRSRVRPDATATGRR
jgi:hypothetical protein